MQIHLMVTSILVLNLYKSNLPLPFSQKHQFDLLQIQALMLGMDVYNLQMFLLLYTAPFVYEPVPMHIHDIFL